MLISDNSQGIGTFIKNNTCNGGMFVKIILLEEEPHTQTFACHARTEAWVWGSAWNLHVDKWGHLDQVGFGVRQEWHRVVSVQVKEIFIPVYFHRLALKGKIFFIHLKVPSLFLSILLLLPVFILTLKLTFWFLPKNI